MKDIKERPILFSGAMVREILAHRKTQTRRVVKYRITGPNPPNGSTFDVYDGETWVGGFGKDGRGNVLRLCPYGKTGERLWVRETWWHNADIPGVLGIAYRADGEMPEYMTERWRPSIHMSREASRITLEITDVRIERVQDISVGDCFAEGIVGAPELVRVYFAQLWGSINLKRGLGWDENPWVFVVSFKSVDLARK